VALIAGGLTYFNIHTTANPGGEISRPDCPWSHRRFRFARSDLGWRWPARLVATAEENRLNISPSPGENLWLLGIWLEHVFKKIPFHHRYKEFTDELTNAHVPELCLER